MVDEAVHDARASAAAAGAARGDGTWKSLAPAVLASLLLHAAALALMPSHARRQTARPELVVTLTGAISVVPRAVAAPAPPAATQARASLPSHAAPAREPKPPTPTAPPAPAAPAPEQPMPAPAPLPPGEEPARPPEPQDDPFTGRVWPQLTGRRLAATVWLRPDGTVEKAVVPRNEIGADTVTLLEEALAKLRFPPAPPEAAAHERAVSTRLCFDEHGRLETASEECWPHAR